jgi:hypothetical protein
MRSILMLVGLFVVGGMVGCADLLGIEPWEDKPLGSSSSGGGGSAGSNSSGGNSSGSDSTGEGSTSSGGVDPCHNGVQDVPETGIDCGGGSCDACADARGCIMDADCRSGFCPMSRGYCITDDGRCGIEEIENPTCGDCIQNAAETDVDCGGDCFPCRQGKGCIHDGECWSGVCSNGTCMAGPAKTRCFSNADCVSDKCSLASPGCLFESCCQ